jgi:ribokinase
VALTVQADTEHILVVVGSINQDYFVYLPEFPRPGQTVFAGSAKTSIGGKGANQAIAAALLGTRVAFVGHVGDDAAGDAARASFTAFGIDSSLLLVHEGAQTGAAFITVNSAGENTIVVNSGSNLLADGATEAALNTVLERRSAGSITILMQGELPVAVVDRAADFARLHGIRFVLNLAPVIPVSIETLATSDPLILNEGEASDILAQLGHSVPKESSGKDHATLLSTRLGTRVIVTLGAAGAAVSDGDESWLQPTHPVDQVVDTTGAGDAFVGALANALVAGRSLTEAVHIGVTAGSLAVRAEGTTASYPTREQLDAATERDEARL